MRRFYGMLVSGVKQCDCFLSDLFAFNQSRVQVSNSLPNEYRWPGTCSLSNDDF